jgi:hypothetical protein
MPTAALIAVVVLLLAVLPATAAGASPAGVSIASFGAEPSHTGAHSETEKVDVGLNLTLRNSGAGSANVTVIIMEEGKILLNRTVTVEGNSSYNFSLLWPLKGIGNHTAVATLSGDDLTAPVTMNASCYVKLLPLVEHPSPWYTIPCALLVIIIPSAGIVLFIRHMRGGDREQK